MLDPRTGEVRYVGKTDDPEFRLSQHLIAVRKGENTYKGRWLRQLLTLELKPELKILEEVLVADWEAAERRWIRHYREQGARLTNATDGGGGVQGLAVECRRQQASSLKATNRAKRQAKGVVRVTSGPQRRPPSATSRRGHRRRTLT